ncbi:uncharacterized protein LOC134253143 isoform X1 [Saccostrea cucullata]|uniref:uncharacterized protein LOC134253143 isoform X1 n=2 Tax=Saccostrea cuccullata TaxID=36930 RepID=UPI002ECFE4E1
MEFSMCNPLLFIIWINIMCSASCHDKPTLLITNKTKVESSSLYVSGSYSGDANKTIDRNFNQSYVDCMHTAPRQSEAWLNIDLGRVFNLKSVRIWYRSDRGAYSTKRLSRFSVLVSNNSGWSVNDTCYQDSGNATLKTVLEVNCFHTARYVKIYAKKNIDGDPILEICELEIYGGKDQNTKRLKGVSIFASYEPVVTSYTSTVDKRYQCYKDPGNVTLDTELELNCTRLAQYVTIYNDQMNDENGVFLEICEVEIYGCPRRRYVKDCTPCDTCKAECDVTGRCDMLGCKEGYHPPFCKVCSPGRYGKDCKEVCGYCERNEPCNHITGSCPGLCEPGYYGEKCLTPCTFGRYGEGCKGICGHCESNKTCNYVNGSCSGLCEPGYHGENCLTKCKDGWFGKECKERCGYCRGNKPCHHVTESCSGLCEAGFHGENCENGVSYQILAGVRELLNLMTELISHRRRKSDLKEKGTSPTDFK